MQIDVQELGPVLRLCDRVRREWHAARIIEGALIFVAVALGGTLVFVMVEMFLVMDELWRWTMLGTWAAVLLAAFGLFVVKRIFENPTDEQVALLVEHSHPELHNEIINAIRFAREVIPQHADFLHAAVRESGDTAAGLSTRGAVSWREVRKSFITSAALAGVWVLLIIVFSGRVFNAFSRMLMPAGNIAKIGSVRIVEVIPGDTEVFVGDNLTVQLVLDKGAPEQIVPRVEYFTEKGPVHEEEMQPTGSNRFSCELVEIKAPRQYRVAAGDSRSAYYNISVTHRPLVNKIGVTYTYPKYTGMGEKTVEDCGGTLRALKGSTAILKITANKRLKSARVIFEGEKQEAPKPIPLYLLGGHKQAMLALANAISITWNLSGKIEIEDESAHKNSRPLSIIAEDDQPPIVRITDPRGDRTLAAGESLELGVRGNDDYGIVRAELIAKHTRIGDQTRAEDQEKTIHEWTRFPDRKEVVIHWTWTFDKKSYKNGDIVKYCVRMYDERDGDLLKTGLGTSAEFIVRIQDPQAMRSQRKKKFESWLAEVEKVLREQRKLRNRTDKLGADKDAPKKPGAKPGP